MATLDLVPTSIISATGWTGATVANLGTSNDVRATGGAAGAVIKAEITGAPGDFGTQNTVTLHVEARTVGTVIRAKSLLVELLDGANNVLQSFTTPSLTGTDAAYASSAFARTDSAAAIDAYRLRATAQEGSGMPDSATVEIDRLWAVLDYNAAAPDPVPTFSDGGLTSIVPTGGGYDVKDLSTADTNGTPTLTAQTPFSDSVPQAIATDQNFERPEWRGIALTAGNTHTIAATIKDVDADRARFTVRDPDTVATESRWTYTPSTQAWATLANEWGDAANQRNSPGPDGTTLIEFDFTPTRTTADARIGIGTGLANQALSIIVYTLDVSNNIATAYELTASPVEAASEAASPAVNQTHGLTAAAAESATEAAQPAIAQVHALTATSAENATEAGAPAVTQVHGLAATGAESASQAAQPAASSGAASLMAVAAESSAEAAAPALTQVHALTALSVSSATEAAAPGLTQSHALVPAGAESASEAASPALSSSSVQTFSDGTLVSAVPTGTGFNVRDLSTAVVVLTPTVTPQAPYLDTVPQQIASDVGAERLEWDGIEVLAGSTYRFAVHAKDVNAGQAQMTLRRPTSGESQTIDYTFATQGFAVGGAVWATVSNTSQQAGPDGTTLIEFDFAPQAGKSESNFKPGAGTGLADDTKSVVVYTMDISQALALAAVQFIYVAKTAGGEVGTPSDANTTIQPTVAAAKAAPMLTVDAAVNAAGPGVLILCQSNTIEDPVIYPEQVLIQAANSGEDGNPIRIVAEVYRGATIRGPAAGGDTSTLLFNTAHDVDIHNFKVHCQADGNNSGPVKVLNNHTGVIAPNRIGIYGSEVFGVCRDLMILAASRQVTTKGCTINGDPLVSTVGESGVDWVEGIDHLLEWCEIFGTLPQAGFAAKGASMRGIVRSCIIDVTAPATGGNHQAVQLGGFGTSRVGRNWGGGGEVFPWAENYDFEITNCELSTTTSNTNSVIWTIGADLANIHLNWMNKPAGGAAIIMGRTNFNSGLWDDQPRIVPAEYVPYAEVDENLAGLADDRVDYQTRNMTILTNWAGTGAPTTITEMNAGTNNTEALVTAADPDTVLTGVRGIAGWDHTAVYALLGGSSSLTALDAEAASEAASPAVTQVHVLTALSVSSATEAAAPAVTQVHGLTAGDAESPSSADLPALSIVHVLAAQDAESASGTSVAGLAQVHALTASPAESAAETAAAAVTQVHALLAAGAEAASGTSVAGLAQVHALTTSPAESNAEAATPAVAQVHALVAAGAASSAEAARPALDVGAVSLTAIGAESAGQAAQPALLQIHTLMVISAASASEAGQPGVLLGYDLIALDVTSAANAAQPALSQGHAVAADNAEAAAEAASPGFTQGHVLAPAFAATAPEAGTPPLGQVHVLAAAGAEAASEAARPAVSTASYSLTAIGPSAASEAGSPAPGQLHVLAAAPAESAAQADRPALSQAQILVALAVTSASETSAAALGVAHFLQALGVEAGTEASNPGLTEFLGSDVERFTIEIGAPARLTIEAAIDRLRIEIPPVTRIRVEAKSAA